MKKFLYVSSFLMLLVNPLFGEIDEKHFNLLSVPKDKFLLVGKEKNDFKYPMTYKDSNNKLRLKATDMNGDFYWDEQNKRWIRPMPTVVPNTPPIVVPNENTVIIPNTTPIFYQNKWSSNCSGGT